MQPRTLDHSIFTAHESSGSAGLDVTALSAAMTPRKLVARRDGWLSNVFGVDCHRLGPAASRRRASASEPPQRALPEEGPLFVDVRLPADAVEAAGDLIAAGMRPVDVTVTLEAAAETMCESSRTGATTTVTAARPDDDAERTALLDLAGRAFTTSRFHLDPAITDGAAAAVKRAWMTSALGGSRGRVLVAHAGDQIAGFVVLLEPEQDSVTVIDLVAVDTWQRGRGIGRALVAATAAAARARSGAAARVRVGTQVANVGSLGFYETCGFRTVGTARVLHGHRVA